MAFSFPPEKYEITGPRLVIRNAIPQDAQALVDLMGKVENLPEGATEAMTGLTIESMVERMGRWNKSASEGKNAFLSIALRDTNEVVGYMGFNCFRSKAEFDGTEPERDLPLPGLEGRYLTDLGVSIDYRQRRRGYSTETICASIEFASETLGCQVVRLETGLANEPWRGLMRYIGFGELEQKDKVSYGNHPIGWLYRVDREAWQKAKANLKANGRWPL
ncbi:putative Gcn5-related n-acetyltransferase [Seiridium cardinale]|uniref:Gcn5-related n-acetyltransferase n=1 Tax=Seiridium cardinale TaxID=138064 RepID=A0ABR2XJC2_9PEZI